MSVQIRPCTSVAEFGAATGAIWHYFGGPLVADLEKSERFSRLLPVERMHAAVVDGAIVGGAGAFPFELTVPGGAVGCAGVTVVGVLPTHRRRGLLRALMHAQLEDIRRRGEPVAALWSAEEPIYRRFGYGQASLGGEVELARGYHALRVPPAPGARARLVTLEEALDLVPPVYDRVRRRTPGMFARSREWWELRQLDDRPETRDGGGARNCVVLELDGEPAAYALYRVQSKFDGGHNVGRVDVIEAIGDDEALLEVWRYLLGLDWVGGFHGSFLPPDHPLLHALEYPRRLGLRLGDALWVRLVDLPAALAARSYASDEPVVLEVEDALVPENAGRWRLAGGGVERTDDEADLALDVRELGSVYLGGFGFGELVRAGLVRELRPGAAWRADAVFRSERKPWCPEIF